MRISDWSSDVCSSDLTGGLVHFIPRKPTREIEGYGEVSYGRFNSVRTEGAVSGPLSDAVRMRASVLYSRQGNYLKNVYPSGTTFIPPIPFGPSVGEDLGGENPLAGRLQFERSDADRVGKECGSTFKSRGWRSS